MCWCNLAGQFVRPEIGLTIVRDVKLVPVSDFERPIFSVALSPNFLLDRQCFAAGPSGLLRSNDGGQTWKYAISSETPVPVLAVVLSPDYGRDGILFAGISGGVLRSWDFGKTWAWAAVGAPPATVSCLAVSPSFGADSLVLAGTNEGGIFRSTDRGTTWQSINFGLLDQLVLCVSMSPAFATDEMVVVGVNSGIFRSKNGGRAWRETAFSNDAAPVLCMAAASNFVQKGTIYAGTEAAGLFVSDDRAQSWSPIGVGQLTGSINAVVLDADFETRPHLLVATEAGLFLSYDGGAAWTVGAPIANILSLAAENGRLDEGRGRVLAGLSTGGVRWVDASSSIS